jgi:hypothetical protein
MDPSHKRTSIRLITFKSSDRENCHLLHSYFCASSSFSSRAKETTQIKQGKMPIILNRADLRSRSRFGYNASSKGGLGGEGGRSRPTSSRPSHPVISEYSCVVSRRPRSMQDNSSSTTTSSTTDMSSKNFPSSVRSLEDYYTAMATKTTKPTPPISLLAIQAMTTSTLDILQPLSFAVDEWGHFVDFQEEPDESWVGAFLNRHAPQKRKSQRQRVQAVVE